ncbi:MAG: iron dicitrate transport regulator FecR, partial [Patescibacteria group bacterium]|nr:iron dicitrate transport regulator FecR [Patescibacteria group bacterium]
MSDAELQKLICDYASGTISPQQHQVLKDTLKSNPNARAVFREWMDLEASLHTWASEDAATPLQGPHESVRRERQHAERLLRGRPF